MHLESLPKLTHNLFTWLQDKDFINKFYLAGGTAIALNFGHRHSQDLDFFSHESFNPNNLKEQLQEYANWQGIMQEKNTLVGELSGAKISFFTIKEQLLETPQTYHNFRIAQLLDLSLMKILAISDRGTKRDFIDLYVLHNQFKPLLEIFSYLPRKYGEWEYNLAHIVRSLGYFVDADSEPMPNMLVNISWSEVKDFFHKESEKIAKQLL